MRQTEVIEEHAPELLRRADVERLAGSSINFGLQPLDVGVHARAQVDQRFRIERDAGAFDLGQHDGHRNFDVGVEAQLIAPLEFDARRARDARSRIRRGGGIIGQRAMQHGRRGLRCVDVRARRIEQVRADHRIVIDRARCEVEFADQVFRIVGDQVRHAAPQRGKRIADRRIRKRAAIECEALLVGRADPDRVTAQRDCRTRRRGRFA